MRKVKFRVVDQKGDMVGYEELRDLAVECCKILGCEYGRISNPLGDKMFFIKGTKRNTRDDAGQWVNQDGEREDWDYISETVVASGKNREELLESVYDYRIIMTIKEYMEYLLEEE